MQLQLIRFDFNLHIQGSWSASPSDVDAFSTGMLKFLTSAGVNDIQLNGNWETGEVNVAFGVDDPDMDAISALEQYVVPALRSCSVSTGWPDDETIENAVGKARVLCVKVQTFG